MNKKKAQVRLDSHQRYLSGISRQTQRTPNVVLVLADDMGYGDISCFGSEAIQTPCLDQLAADGVRLNNFYASSAVCSASRFGCLTGRYPNRGFVNGVFFPTVKSPEKFINNIVFPYGIKGILPDEITSAEALKAAGYATGLFGKWHLGDCSPYRPNEKGFDYFFGSYYSNDMKPYAYYRNDDIALPAEVDQTTLTQTLTGEIGQFIDQHHDKPFFVYYPSPFPHHPVHASAAFTGKSLGGAYGDCVSELDWSIGEIRKKLEEHNLTENTIFIFTSDNGPWYEGSPGLHRGRKGNSFDGGQIVPFIAAWPGKIPAGSVVDYTAMNIDIFPMMLKLAGVPLPNDREIDGRDLLPLLTGESRQDLHENLYFINFKRLFAVRNRNGFKYCIRAKSENTAYRMSKQGPFLFDLRHDRNESYNVASHYPALAAELKKTLDAQSEAMTKNPRGWKDNL